MIEMSEIKLIGIDDNWRSDIGIGVLAGLFIIFVFGFSGLSMAYPPPLYQQSAASAFVNLLVGLVVVTVLAPIFEEPLFRGVVQFAAYTITKNMVASIIITALFFSIFHWGVYGEGLPAAFVGAFIFSIISSLLTIQTESVLPSIVTHAMVNFWLFLQANQLFAVAGV